MKPISADSHITEPPGTYVDRIDRRFKDRAPRKVEELLYGVPGVSVFNTDGRLVPYGVSKGAYCRLTMFVDGKRYPFKGRDELAIPAADVRAIEIYPRATEAPAEFHDPDNALCGAIVIWTKVD